MNKKIMGLILVGIMSLSVVGCNKKVVLQKEIDIFKSINNCEKNIEGLNAKDYDKLELTVYEVVIDTEVYHQFKKDTKEIGLKEAREKYGINELIEEMIVASKKQNEFDIQCRIVTDEDYNITGEDIDPCETLAISVYNKEVEKDIFK